MAISLDTSAKVENQTGSSYSGSYTCTGFNRLLIVGIQITDGTTSVSSMTYNGVALTKVAHKNTPNNSRRVELWYLINPAPGSNTLAVTLSGSVTDWFSLGIVSFKGVRDTTFPDATANSSADSGLTDVTQAVTTITDNCWLVGIMSNGNSANPVADSGTTLRQSIYNRTGNGYEAFLMDSNGAKTPPGSFALGVSANSSGGTIIVASFAPMPDLTETVSVTDSMVAGTGASVMDTISVSDSETDKIGFSNQSKSDSSWSNLPKS